VHNHPTDPLLPAAQWAQISAEFVDAVGLAPAGELDAVRCVAVRHADDHIHVMATLVRQDGRTVWPRHDYRRCHMLPGRSIAGSGCTSSRCLVLPGWPVSDLPPLRSLPGHATSSPEGLEVGYVTEDGDEHRNRLVDAWAVRFERCRPAPQRRASTLIDRSMLHWCW
jgi:hypothetical protein